MTDSTYEPPPIRQLSAPDLKALLESGTAIELVDVRTEHERARATIDGSCLLDQAYHDALLLRDRDTLGLDLLECWPKIRAAHRPQPAAVRRAVADTALM